ncbi:MAG: hypothetical protein J0H87_08075 [Holosporales bacterium]|nr:hypothetical protein [Holosporales bacterium]
MKIKFFSFILFFLLIGYLNFSFDLRASRLNFSELSFYINDPDSYTIYLADKTRVNPSAIKSLDVSEGYKHYFRSDLFENDKVTFSQHPPQNIKKWVRISQTPDNSGLIARLMIPYSSSAENFLERISVHHSTGDADKHLSVEEQQRSDQELFKFSGGMIIFPQTERYATIYTFGNAWKTLLNPYIIVPRWGLRIVASNGFCDPHQIREISAHYFRNPIPSKRKERSAAVEDISRFGIEVASEGIESLRVRPDSSYGTKRIVKGADYLNFCVTKRDESNKETTLVSLKHISAYFFNLSMQDTFTIHKSLKCFVDDEVREEGLIKSLSEQLLTLMRSNEAVYNLFLHDWIWSLFDTKVLRFGEGRTTEIFDHLPSIETLQSTIKISTLKGERSSWEPISKLFYSLPIEDKDHFYRYDRGMWFHVDASRFNAIKKVLRSFKSSSQDLGLPEYCLDDLMGDRKDYAEFRYNKRAVAHLNSLPGHKAYLIDRLNIPLENGRGHIFEFGDIFLIKNGQYFIIHVKREDASDLSHHREQVERSADYLSSVLNRKINASFFLEASINDLLRDHGLEKPKAQEGLFQKMLKGRHDASRRLEILLSAHGQEPNEEQAKKLFNFKQLISKILCESKSTSLFNKHLNAFCEALDILWLCVHEGKISLDNDATKINSFIERTRLAIEGGTALFASGLLKKTEQEKVTFVLAIVDDRGVEHFVDSEIKKEDKKLERNKAKKAVLDRFCKDDKRFSIVGAQDKTLSLFKNQDLWGLDKTRMAVQRQGFHFSLVVTNENADDAWDAFGSKEETVGTKDETDEVKDENNPQTEDIQISFPKGMHTKTRDSCIKIVSHMQKNPNKKYTKKEIEDEESLQIKSAKTVLDKLVELKVINHEKQGRSYQYFLNESYKFSLSKPGDLSTATSGSSSISSGIDIKKEPISLVDYFKITLMLSVSSLNYDVSQKLVFPGPLNALQGLYAEYLTCPTIGDGNCFFHAVFTEPGDTYDIVTHKTAILRANFYNIIQTNNAYAKSFASLVYEYYRGLWGTRESDNIPELIRLLLQEDDEYVAARNTLIKLGVNPLPVQLSSLHRHSVDHITSQISLDHIRSYMERLKVVGGPQTYIPVRNEAFCPAEALALLGQKRVNIFTYNKDSNQLFLYKSATSPERMMDVNISNFSIVNILHTGNHYIRLFNPSEGVLYQGQCQQIIQNYGD